MVGQEKSVATAEMTAGAPSTRKSHCHPCSPNAPSSVSSVRERRPDDDRNGDRHHEERARPGPMPSRHPIGQIQDDPGKNPASAMPSGTGAGRLQTPLTNIIAIDTRPHRPPWYVRSTDARRRV